MYYICQQVSKIYVQIRFDWLKLFIIDKKEYVYECNYEYDVNIISKNKNSFT